MVRSVSCLRGRVGPLAGSRLHTCTGWLLSSSPCIPLKPPSPLRCTPLLHPPPCVDVWIRSLVDPTSSSSPACEGALAAGAYGPLLSTLTHEDLAGKILPVLQRALKAKTLPAMQVSALLLASSGLDVSRWGVDKAAPARAMGRATGKCTPVDTRFRWGQAASLPPIAVPRSFC
jgi:hypothetical protein